MAHDSVTNLITSYDTLNALTADLSADQWAVQSYCPDWDVRGVVAHLAAVEDLMAGWTPTAADHVPPFDQLGAFMEEVGALDGPGTRERFNSITDVRRAELGALTDADLAAPSGTPVGPGTYGRFLSIRVFDFWVHEQDIRGPLGIAGNEGGPVAVEAMDQTLSSLPYIFGKKVGLEDGMSCRLNLTGPLELERFVQVDGRAGIVDSVANPTFELQANSTTFQMLACGRIDPQAEIDAGRITWSGDASWGERAARNLRYTM